MITTIEPCPTCRSIATCEHLSGIHLWDCPNCGEIVATVGYDCPDCAVGRAIEQAEGRTPATKVTRGIAPTKVTRGIAPKENEADG